MTRVESNNPQENKSIWNSRLVKVGLVTFSFGAVLGFGVIAEYGALAIAGGAGWHLVSKKRK